MIESTTSKLSDQNIVCIDVSCHQNCLQWRIMSCLLCLNVFFYLRFKVPATREVLASLPNVFSALCLNTRGLEAFVACKPFDRVFKVLLSPDYLPAMRRRRSSEPFGKKCFYGNIQHFCVLLLQFLLNCHGKLNH